MYKFFKKFILFYIVWAIFFSLVNKAKADLYFNTYNGTGAYPTFPGNGGTLTYSTPRSSGTVTRIYHNWGSGAVLNSGLAERVIVNYYGYITIPTAGTYTFYNASDDGFYMKIDGAVVINDWQEQGTQYYNGVGTKTFASAGTYAIDVWYYENGGGAAAMLFWNLNGSIQTVSADYYTTVIPTPVYSSAPNSTQLQKRTDTRNITGSGVYINQIGDNLNLDVIQDGQDNLIAGVNTNSQSTSDAVVSGDYNTINLSQKSDNNVLLFGVNGDHNDLIVSQGDNINDIGGHRAIIDITGNYNYTSLTQYNIGYGLGQFSDININGNDNTVTSFQRETDKMLFVDIDGSNNTITTNQKDTGNHFLDITLGSNQTVTATQEGSGDHNATINMGGYTSSLSLTQSGTTDKVYSLEQTCANIGGCATTTINQQ
jgi:hypothetical protein